MQRTLFGITGAGFHFTSADANIAKILNHFGRVLRRHCFRNAIAQANGVQEAVRPVAVNDLIPIVVGTFKAMFTDGPTKTVVPDAMSIRIHSIPVSMRSRVKFPRLGIECL